MELDLAELFQRLPQLIAKFRSAEWSVWDMISTGLAALGTIATVVGTYIRWRNSGIRRAERLKEFLAEREDRVAAARWNLRAITNRPTAQLRNQSERPTPPLFIKSQLDKRTRQRPWIWIFNRHTALDKAIALGRDRLAIAKRAIDTNHHELFLAHLTRGAMHDSRGQHEDALEHFTSALKLKPDDLQALEYAGLQLVLLGSAEAAIEHLDIVTVTNGTDDLTVGSFDPEGWRQVQLGNASVSAAELSYLTRLLALSYHHGDVLNAARAHRAVAFAFERSTVPKPRDAVRHARLAAQLYPDSAPVEEQAQAWEHVGCLVYNRSPYHWQAAQGALRKARKKFSGLHPRSAARRNVKRIDQLLAKVEKPRAADPPDDDIGLPDKILFDHLLAPLKARNNQPPSTPTSPV